MAVFIYAGSIVAKIHAAAEAAIFISIAATSLLGMLCLFFFFDGENNEKVAFLGNIVIASFVMILLSTVLFIFFPDQETVTQIINSL